VFYDTVQIQEWVLHGVAILGCSLEEVSFQNGIEGKTNVNKRKNLLRAEERK
jgi:hypothetical protein